MKRCSECQKQRPLSEFHRRASAKDGLQAQCKACRNAKERRRYQEDPEFRLRALARSHQRVATGSHRAANQRWYKRNSA